MWQWHWQVFCVTIIDNTFSNRVFIGIISMSTSINIGQWYNLINLILNCLIRCSRELLINELLTAFCLISMVLSNEISLSHRNLSGYRPWVYFCRGNVFVVLYRECRDVRHLSNIIAREHVVCTCSQSLPWLSVQHNIACISQLRSRFAGIPELILYHLGMAHHGNQSGDFDIVTAPWYWFSVLSIEGGFRSTERTTTSPWHCT